MSTNRFSGIIILSLMSFFAFSQQDKADTNTRNLKIYPFPAFGYSPETGVYFGAVGLANFRSAADTNTRESNAKAEFNYSLKKQLILELGWNYFSPGERWFSEAVFRVSQFPDLYYGIGPGSTEKEEVEYNSNRIQISVNWLYQISKNLFLGPQFRYGSYSKLSYLGGDSISFAGLKASESFGLGGELRKDLRSSLLTPVNGYLSSWRLSYNQFTGKGYLKFQPDQRVYIPYRDNLVWASRFYGDWNFGEAPPFYDLGLLGGDLVARGIYLGRFRDQFLTTVQTEVRYRLFWRIGIAAFAGVSEVHGELKEFSLAGLKYNGGGGLRFLVDKKSNVNLRFDYGLASNGQTGFYVAFGEAF